MRNQEPIHSIFIKAVFSNSEPRFERMRIVNSKTSSVKDIPPKPMIYTSNNIGSQMLIFQKERFIRGIHMFGCE